MREAAESFLREYPSFTSVAGTAEETTLADASVEMVTAGQAFHWFDRSRAKAEFKRILKPGGWIVVFWNCRVQDSPYQDAYVQALRRHSPEYEQVKHENTDESEIHQFFEPGGYKVHTLKNSQVFHFEGLKGRLLSCSYAPEAGQAEYDPMLSELRTIFDMYQQDGQIIMKYDLRLYIGKAG